MLMSYFFMTERTSEMSSLTPVSIRAIATPSMAYMMSWPIGVSPSTTV